MVSFFRFTIITFFLITQYLQAQSLHALNSSEIRLGLKKFANTASVLYLAAHPDDENTGLIAYIDNELLARTAYLSLTRGDGGQNLIGTEQGALLGLIRTQELLEARKIDKGEQFFTRAYDFGFSKSPEETFTKWNKDSVLHDVVWVIRKFRPDIIITRFSDYEYYGHGHHSASAILAMEAFEGAADPARFPEQLKYVGVWQAERLLFNSSTWFKPDLERFYAETGRKYIKENIGVYNPLLGKTYSEIAALSRSMHKSQGFGTSPRQGEHIEYLEHRLGSVPEKGMLDNITTDWSRFEGGKKIDAAIRRIIREFDDMHPEKSVPSMIKLYQTIAGLPRQDNPLLTYKKEELKGLILSAMGLRLQAYADKYYASPGDTIQLALSAINRSALSATLKTIILDKDKVEPSVLLKKNTLYNQNVKKDIASDALYSQPYWLRKPIENDLFFTSDYQLLGKPEGNPALYVTFVLLIEGMEVVCDVPVVYQWTDPVAGEQFRPFEITPEVTLNFTEPSYVFTSSLARTVNINVKALKDNQKGRVRLNVPESWRVQPDLADVSLVKAGEEKMVSFTIIPPAGSASGNVSATYISEHGKQESGKGISIVAYPHMLTQTVFPESEATLSKIDIARTSERIAYVQGAGDKVAGVLSSIGYKVDILSINELALADLSRYDVIITGVRAYNIWEELSFLNTKLLDFVKNGGNLIVQYNVNRGLKTEQIGPYPFTLSRDRVTVEDSPFSVLKPEHAVLNIPNKITDADFSGWVQERGLYFADTWAEQYETILGFQDPGEEFLNGGLLIARYGNGSFIYTGLAFFRQLPAGVPGAYKLFINLIAYNGRK